MARAVERICKFIISPLSVASFVLRCPGLMYTILLPYHIVLCIFNPSFLATPAALLISNSRLNDRRDYIVWTDTSIDQISSLASYNTVGFTFAQAETPVA